MSPPWMPLYIRDYLADTSHLRAIESGAYLHLIMAYWVGGKLPNDDLQLATIAKMTRMEWARSRRLLEPFFGPGFSSHKRIDAELARAAEVSASYAARASQASRKRWSKHAPSNASSMPQAFLEECLDMPSSPTHKNSEVRTSAADAAFDIAEPANEDPKAKLYRVGKTTLVSFGIAEKRTGALIGQWLKIRNDPIGLLAAIAYARDQNVAEPVAYISTLVNGNKSNGQHGKQDLSSMCFAVADELLERERAASAGRPTDPG